MDIEQTGRDINIKVESQAVLFKADLIKRIKEDLSKNELLKKWFIGNSI